MIRVRPKKRIPCYVKRIRSFSRLLPHNETATMVSFVKHYSIREIYTTYNTLFGGRQWRRNDASPSTAMVGNATRGYSCLGRSSSGTFRLIFSTTTSTADEVGNNLPSNIPDYMKPIWIDPNVYFPLSIKLATQRFREWNNATSLITVLRYERGTNEYNYHLWNGNYLYASVAGMFCQGNGDVSASNTGINPFFRFMDNFFVCQTNPVQDSLGGQVFRNKYVMHSQMGITSSHTWVEPISFNVHVYPFPILGEPITANTRFAVLPYLSVTQHASLADFIESDPQIMVEVLCLKR